MILDTNALSAFVVLGDFRYGLAASRYRARNKAWLDQHLPDFDILAVTEASAVVYASIRVALKKAGRPIPANDAWICAPAIEHRLPVLTRDVRCDAVPNLRRIDW